MLKHSAFALNFDSIKSQKIVTGQLFSDGFVFRDKEWQAHGIGRFITKFRACFVESHLNYLEATCFITGLGLRHLHI